MGDQAKALDLSTAEAALERGDYGQCLELLAPLAEARPLPDPEGSRIRLLMVTALMGQGREQDAVSTCRLLSRAGDPDLRLQARQLLSILEAPSLERPERWSTASARGDLDDFTGEIQDVELPAEIFGETSELSGGDTQQPLGGHLAIDLGEGADLAVAVVAVDEGAAQVRDCGASIDRARNDCAATVVVVVEGQWRDVIVGCWPSSNRAFESCPAEVGA